MRNFVMVILIIIFGISVSSTGFSAKEFKQVDRWNHGDREIYGTLAIPVITEDGNIITCVGKKGFVLIAKDRVDLFAPLGEGPNQVWMAGATALYGNDIAFLMMGHKMKIFTKKDNTYKESKTRWFKQGYYAPTIRDILFIEKKWFFAGLTPKKGDNTGSIEALLEVYDDEGKPIKTLIEKEFKPKSSYHNMDYYIVANKDPKKRVFLFSEYELKAYEISTDKLELVKEWNLETPGFYKKMPDDYYMSTKKNYAESFMRYLSEWKTTYSRIIEVAVEDGYLVLQIRTCDEKQKKYAMLFYNVDTLKLEKTIFTDDFFFGARDGKYYFYANGNPGRDEGVDECIINIFAFEEK